MIFTVFCSACLAILPIDLYAQKAYNIVKLKEMGRPQGQKG
nr:MAG TPA_asm: hypothetical protein [Bacteriophage sp.]